MRRRPCAVRLGWGFARGTRLRLAFGLRDRVLDEAVRDGAVDGGLPWDGGVGA